MNSRLCFFILFALFLNKTFTFQNIVINATINTTYELEINSALRYSFIFNILNVPSYTIPAFRVHAYSKEASILFPILFVVEQQKSVLSWQIPISLDEKYGYYYNNLSRTLCPEPDTTLVGKTIIIDASTMFNKTVTFLIMAEIIDVNLSQSLANISLTPSSPSFFVYTFPKDVNQVIVKVESDDDLCSVLAVQSYQCPIFDSIFTVTRALFKQTVTYRGAITLKKNSFISGNSFLVILIVRPNDLNCAGLQKLSPDPGSSRRQKNYTSIRVDMMTNRYQFLIAVFVPLFLFLSFYLISFIVGICYYRWTKRITLNIDTNEQEVRDIIGAFDCPRSYGAIIDHKDDNPLLFDSYSVSIDSTSVSEVQSNADTSDRVDINVFLSVADLSKKSHKSLDKKYSLYTWNLITISIFYILPVIQLVLTYQMVVNKTGDEDSCFYNFFCANRLGFLSSFNNVYSNIGYILLGFLFIILVYRRDKLHSYLVLCEDRSAINCGIPQHFGVFYAMGIALVMEGLLSGCYHVCPSYSNFQFDTSFMYMIGWLCMIKIYQTRHHDVNTHSHIAYCIIAFVVLIGVIGVTGATKTFWIVFAVIYILFIFLLSIQVYYMGEWSLDMGVAYRIYRMIRYEKMLTSWPIFFDRLLLIVMANLVNLSMAIFGVLQMPYDFASYLLAIIILNLLMYFLFYIIMKLRNSEKIKLFPLLYIIMATVTWILGLYFFMIRLTSWQDTPATSRERNEDCLLLDFYDSHDVWHFLSAISLFLSFMILLTLDDDLHNVPRDSIRVF